MKGDSKRKGDKYGGFRYSDGMTPAQRRDHYTARLTALKVAERERRLITIEEVDAERQSAAEQIKSDLFGLPLRLAGKLSGRKFEAHEVKAIIEGEIRQIVEGWHKAGSVDGSALA